jgi:hypothetical protein
MRMQEQLTGMGDAFSDMELVTVILGLLPKSYRPLINTISISARHANIELKPTVVVESLIDEFEHLLIEEQQLKSFENALTAKGKGRGRGNGTSQASGSPKTDVECWNCERKGHIKS